jgi:hypothetical protein
MAGRYVRDGPFAASLRSVIGRGIVYQAGFRGSGFRGAGVLEGSGFEVRGSGFEVRGSRFGVRGSGFEVRGSRFGVRGSGFGTYFNRRAARFSFSSKLEKSTSTVP